MDSGRSRTLVERKRIDNIILKSFIVVFVLILIVFIGFNISSGDLTDVPASVMIALMLAFFITGLVSIILQRRIVKIPVRKILVWFILASLLLGVSFALVLYTLDLTNSVELTFGTENEVKSLLLIGVFLVSFVVAIIVELFLLVLGFGAIGVVIALERRYSPKILVRLANLSDNKKKGLFDSIIAWIFNVPPYLDSSTLKVNYPRGERFPWRRFWKATGWEVLFAALVALYISLNPFLLSGIRIEQLFSTLTSASYLLPLIILPWFIYAAIDAKITGVTKDFRLYDGIKSKVFQTIGLLGTIVIFIRFALERNSGVTILLLFTGFIVIFLIVATLFNFIYFNSFEEDLGADVCETFESMRSARKSEGG
ncbi:MAG TPA: hypothetical protein VMW26_06630 [Methanomassiliicoccales archaeon]|nr:hypothetical protein [Methanomassiliicoccales archaeon]